MGRKKERRGREKKELKNQKDQIKFLLKRARERGREEDGEEGEAGGWDRREGVVRCERARGRRGLERGLGPRRCGWTLRGQPSSTSTEFPSTGFPSFHRWSPFSRIRLKTTAVGSAVRQSGTILARFFAVIIFFYLRTIAWKLCKGARSVCTMRWTPLFLCFLIDSLDPSHVPCAMRDSRWFHVVKQVHAPFAEETLPGALHLSPRWLDAHSIRYSPR